MNPGCWHLQGSGFGQQCISKSQAVGNGQCFHFSEAEPVFPRHSKQKLKDKDHMWQTSTCSIQKSRSLFQEQVAHISAFQDAHQSRHYKQEFYQDMQQY